MKKLSSLLSRRTQFLHSSNPLSSSRSLLTSPTSLLFTKTAIKFFTTTTNNNIFYVEEHCPPSYLSSPYGTNDISSFISLRITREVLQRSICNETRTSVSVEDTHSSSYYSVRIECKKELSGMLSEALLCFGACSAYIEDDSEFEDLDTVYITTIFTDDRVIKECISLAASSIEVDIPKFDVQKGDERDWVKASQEMFQPVKIDDALWIIPMWRDPPDAHAMNIFLDPGLAFGTGEHPTTKLCLLLLLEVVKGGESVLDYGTGSGILGITAIKLGASRCIGIDIDNQAITSASQNAGMNDIRPNTLQLYLYQTINPSSSQQAQLAKESNPYVIDDMPTSEKHDIVIANILLNPLVELAEKITGHGKPRGTVCLSGVLCEQVPEMERCYSRYLDDIVVSEMDGWACLRGTRKL